jgi:hypothetical protein
MSRKKPNKVYAVRKMGFHAVFAFAIARHSKGAISVVRAHCTNAPKYLVATETDRDPTKETNACNPYEEELD